VQDLRLRTFFISMFMKIVTFLQRLIKSSKIKFYQNPSSSSWVETHRQTDGHAQFRVNALSAPIKRKTY
jgi:hypothetical protein